LTGKLFGRPVEAQIRELAAPNCSSSHPGFVLIPEEFSIVLPLKLKVGDGIRTHDVQLGKLTVYRSVAAGYTFFAEPVLIV